MSPTRRPPAKRGSPVVIECVVSTVVDPNVRIAQEQVIRAWVEALVIFMSRREKDGFNYSIAN